MRKFNKPHEVYGGWTLIDNRGFAKLGDDCHPIIYPTREAAEAAIPASQE